LNGGLWVIDNPDSMEHHMQCLRNPQTAGKRREEELTAFFQIVAFLSCDLESYAEKLAAEEVGRHQLDDEEWASLLANTPTFCQFTCPLPAERFIFLYYNITPPRDGLAGWRNLRLDMIREAYARAKDCWHKMGDK
jgi:hypothetical protein